MPLETHDTASEFATRYAATVAFVARFCVDGAARVESTGSGCWAICGALANGLSVEVTNEQMDINGPGQAFYVGLFDPDGGQVAAYEDGELADQLSAAASLGPDQVAELCRDGHGVVWLDAGAHTTVIDAGGDVLSITDYGDIFGNIQRISITEGEHGGGRQSVDLDIEQLRKLAETILQKIGHGE